MKKAVCSMLALLLWAVVLTPVDSRALDAVKPGPDARCMACGMLVAPYPNWVSVASFKDGSHYFFDGPKDMFVFFANLTDYLPEASLQDIKELQVTEYYTLQRLDAREVFFVSGSDVLGPMGKELVPVAGEKNLKVFIRDHGQAKILKFDGEAISEVNPFQ